MHMFLISIFSIFFLGYLLPQILSFWVLSAENQDLDTRIKQNGSCGNSLITHTLGSSYINDEKMIHEINKYEEKEKSKKTKITRVSNPS